MRRKPMISAAVCFWISLSAAPRGLADGLASAPDSTPRASNQARSDPPPLVVVVVIDQFPYEFIERFRSGFSDKGIFERLRRTGADFTDCKYEQALTVTACGHSVLLAGAYPWRTGIVENEWFDRTAGKVLHCAGDPAARQVGADAKPDEISFSPRNLLVPALGDELKLATNGRARVFGVAIKERSAILPAGHMADGAYWYDGGSGNWVTSSYYREALPDYMRAFNESDALTSLAGKTWDLLHPADRYTEYYPDDSPLEGSLGPLGRAFPHKLPSADSGNTYKKLVVGTPFGNDLTLAAARTILEHEQLGRDEFPDILCISLSSNDVVGHAYGPYSREVADITYRTDVQLAEFAEVVDKAVGDDKWVLALTADHGVGPIPEHAAELKLPSGRQPLGKAKDLAARLEERLCGELGKPVDNHAYVQHVNEYEVFLNRGLPELAGDRYLAAQRVVRDYLLEQPAVAAAFTRETLLAAGSTPSSGGSAGLLGAFARSFHPRRSGDVMYALATHYLPSPGNRASHGSPWNYDAHVPLFLAGPGIRSGRYHGPASPANLAPTLARLLRISPPAACEARTLDEALDLSP